MNLKKWIKLAKDDRSEPPQVHRDEWEDDDTYWVGYADSGMEMPLAKGMMKSTAEFFQKAVAELFNAR